MRNRLIIPLVLVIGAGAAGGGVAAWRLARRPLPSPATAVPAAAPASPAAPADPAARFADAVVEFLAAIHEGNAIEERLAAFNGRFYTPSGRKVLAERFHRLLEQGSVKAAKYGRDKHQALWRKLLGPHRPELAKRFDDPAFADIVASFPCEEYVPTCERGGEPPAVADPGQACADVFADYVQSVVDGKLRMAALRKRMDELGDAIDQAQLAAFGVTGESWLCGERPDLDLPARAREAVRARHPQAADEVFAFYRDRISNEAKHGQDDAKRMLLAVHAAERVFHDLDLAGDGRHDYWTADVSGLARLLVGGERIDLIPPDAAAADAAPLAGADLAPQPEKHDRHRSTRGRWSLYALQAVPGDAGGEALSREVDASGQARRNRERFAVCAVPLGYGRVGRQTYLVDESGALWFKDTGGKPVDRVPVDRAADGWSPVKDADHGSPPPRLPAFVHLRRLKEADPTARREALYALGGYTGGENGTTRLPPAAVQAVASALADGDRDVVEAAAEALHRLGPDACDIGLAVAQARLTAAGGDELLRALSRMLPKDARLVPLLAQGLASKNADTRLTAAMELGDLGATAAQAVPALAAALQDDGVADAAADTLGRIGPPAAAAVPALATLASHGSLAAWRAMERIGVDPDTEVAALSALLPGQHATGIDVAAAIDRLIAAGKTKAVVPLLGQMAGMSGPDAEYATTRLAALAGGDASAATLLVKTLHHGDPDVRAAAAIACAQAGAAVAERAVPELGAMLADPTPSPRIAAATALWKLQPRPAPAVACLQQLLLDEDPGVRARALDALRALSPPPASIIPDLAPLRARLAAETNEPAARIQAVVQLERLAPVAPAAVDGVVQALADGEVEVQLAAAQALTRLGPAAAPAVAAVSERLRVLPVQSGETADEEVGEAALASALEAALAAIGPGAAAAVPLLAERAKQGDEPAFRALIAVGADAGTVATAAAGAADIDDGRPLRDRLADRIGELADHDLAAAAVALCGKLVASEDEIDMHVGIDRLTELAAKAPAAVTALSAALADPRPACRGAAALALGGLGTAAPASALEALLKDGEPYPRACAAVALGKVRGEPLVEALVAASTGDDGPSRRIAVPALAAAGGEPAQRVAKQQRDVLADAAAAPAARTEAIRVLVALHAAADSGDALCAALNQGTPTVKTAAARALGEIAAATPAAIEALALAIDDRSTADFDDDTTPVWTDEGARPSAPADVRTAAMQALAALGPPAKAAAPRLALLVGKDPEAFAALLAIDPDPDRAGAIVRGIAAAGGSFEEIAPWIRSLYDHGLHAAAVPALAIAIADHERVEAAMSSIVEAVEGQRVDRDHLGPFPAAAMVPLLTKALAGDEEQVRSAATQCLAAVGETAAPALPDLRALAANGEAPPLLRVAAAHACWRIAHGADETVKLLRPVLAEETVDASALVACAAVLGEIGPGAASLLPNLRRLMAASDDEDVKAALDAAIQRIAATP